MTTQNLYPASKYLAYLLRHGAVKSNLELRDDGFALLEDVLLLPRARKLNLTFELVREIVDKNDKKRFELKEEKGVWLIKATQGHSLPVKDLALKPIRSITDLPRGVAIHGTYLRSWKTIRTEGLSRMTRNHIHFSASLPDAKDGSDAVVSGLRGNAEVLIYLNVASALEDGIDLFLSANNVILSPGFQDGTIPPQYFLAVVSSSDLKPFDPDFVRQVEKE
jgi:2'-phosphotransferase